VPSKQRHPDREAVPVVQRLRVHFAKRGRLRFTSHRDFQRFFERAVRRADVPVAHSAGFSPHPRISYVGAAPTGAASEAEYLEIALAARRDPEQVRAALDAALPAGYDVIEVVEAGRGSLAERIDASHWRVRLLDVEPDAVAAAVAAFLAADEVLVERVLKDGRRTLDARQAVVRLTVAAGTPADASGDSAGETPAADTPGAVEPGESSGCAILDLVVRHVSPAVRPDDVVTGLRQVSDLRSTAPPPPLVTRLAQGHLDESGRLVDPLAPDRGNAAGSIAEHAAPATA
jgi:radical SAM-linked protein